MDFKVNHAIDVLARTPVVIRDMLQHADEPWVHNNYGESTFSPFDVLGHLIHGERTDWIPRARIIETSGETRPFDPFDRYAQFEESRGKTIDQLLDTFEDLRKKNLLELADMNLGKQQLDQTGTHPELGSVTMRQLLATWVVHDLNHIAQIAKAMAFQYDDQVGPWKKFISILKPPAPAG